MLMAKFYVVKARRVLWNVLVLAAAVALLAYVFSVEEQDAPEPVGPAPVPMAASPSARNEDGAANMTSAVDMDEGAALAAVSLENGEPPEFAALAELAAVKPVPAKFSEYRMERERVRSRQMELLQNIAADAAVDAEARVAAQAELQELLATAAREAEIENLLRAKGYIDGVAVLDQGSAIVVVPATLTREEAAQIGDLVNRLTGIRLEHITIVDEPLTV